MTTAVAPTTGTSTWTLDPSHSTVGFSVKHLMISTVRGTFTDITATVTGDDRNIKASTVAVSVGVASVNTRTEQRDAHLRSPDFFDAETFPTMTFTSTRLERGGSADFQLAGDLTIRGVTREVVLDVTDEGRASDPWGGTRAGFTARTRIKRSDFGLTWNQALETGGVVVGDEVRIEADVQFVKG